MDSFDGLTHSPDFFISLRMSRVFWETPWAPSLAASLYPIHLPRPVPISPSTHGATRFVPVPRNASPSLYTARSGFCSGVLWYAAQSIASTACGAAAAPRTAEAAALAALAPLAPLEIKPAHPPNGRSVSTFSPKSSAPCFDSNASFHPSACPDRMASRERGANIVPSTFDAVPILCLSAYSRFRFSASITRRIFSEPSGPYSRFTPAFHSSRSLSGTL